MFELIPAMHFTVKFELQTSTSIVDVEEEEASGFPAFIVRVSLRRGPL